MASTLRIAGTTRNSFRTTPAGASGPPASGDHEIGEEYVDSLGSRYVCVADGTPGTWRKVIVETDAAAGDLGGTFPNPTVKKASADFSLSGILTPATITVDENNYNPAGLSGASILALSSDAARAITGLAGGASGRIVVLVNVGTFSLKLVSASGSSDPANRFSLKRSFTAIAPGCGIILAYNVEASRWRVMTDQRTLTNFTSTVDPTVTDDNTQGYSVGSRWINTITKTIFTCVLSTTGAAEWAIDTQSSSNLSVIVKEATDTITTTSDTDVLAISTTPANNLSITPGAGTFEVWFTGSYEVSNGAQTVFTSIYVNGVQKAASERRSKTGGGNPAGFACMTVITVGAGLAIEGRWRVTGATGTMYQRTLLVRRIG